MVTVTANAIGKALRATMSIWLNPFSSSRPLWLGRMLKLFQNLSVAASVLRYNFLYQEKMEDFALEEVSGLIGSQVSSLKNYQL